MKTLFCAILNILFLSIGSIGLAQKNIQTFDDTLSLTEWLISASNYDKESPSYRNIWIKADLKGKDSNLISHRYDTSYLGTYTIITEEECFDKSSIRLNRPISADLINCKLSGFEVLDGLIFDDLFLFDCDIQGLDIKNCQFQRLYVKGDDWNSISITNSVFKNSCSINSNNAGNLEIRETSIRGFSYNGRRGFALRIRGQYQEIKLHDIEFKDKDSLASDSIYNLITVNLSDLNVNSLIIKDIVLSSIDVENAIISKSLLFESLEITDFFLAKSLDLPLSNTNLNWSILGGGKLGIKNNEKDFFKGSECTESLNNIQFTELLSVYQRMLNLYKERGDRKSYNACYVEMRDLETKRLKFDYKKEQTLNNLFSWRMNQFLKQFCDFGTNPVKPLIISIWIIIYFGIMYFFFYNDKLNGHFVMKQYQNLIYYFTVEEKKDLFNNRLTKKKQKYDEYIEQINNENEQVPFFVPHLTRVVFHFLQIRYVIALWIYRNIQIPNIKRIKLTLVRRTLLGLMCGGVIIVFIVGVIVMRLLKSVMLSVNSFSTLGFGDIPVRGVSKYLAILEGFLGWFLLSILSVSLISQILPT